MASKSKSRPQRKKPPNQLANLGLFDMPNLDLDNIDEDLSDVDESTLESELELLMRGETSAPRRKPKPKAAAPVLDIEKLAEECLKDDDEDDDDDEDLSTNEELMKELQQLAPDKTLEIETPIEIDEPTEQSSDTSPESLLTVLYSRLDLYKEAQNVAKCNSETSKARRYERAIKTLDNLIKSAKTGSNISEDDIPPIVSIPKISAPSPRATEITPTPHTPASAITDTSANQNSEERKVSYIPENESNASATISLLMARQNEYKVAALQAKKAGNKELAIKYMKTAKTFDSVIEAANKNQPVDIKNMPPTPPEYSGSTTQGAINLPKRSQEQVQTSSTFEAAALEAANEEPQPELFSAPPAPTTVLDALEQRLNKYTETKQAAESEGNNSKARRLQRIIKSYETAIKDHKAGKSVAYEELPCPPGFAPIPVSNVNTNNKETRESVKPSPAPPPPVKPPIKPTTTNTESNSSNTTAVKKPKIQRTNTATSTAEKQLEFLLERQKLFREAALSAKREGNIQQAKEYLKMSKGFDSMIEACKCGLPIDVSSIPTPPQLEENFFIVNLSDCIESKTDLTQEELFESLEKDLLKQLEICSKNKEHFLRLGDVLSASKFEKLALESKKDLSVIQCLKLKGELVPPKFHYENRVFSIVQCNSYLTDNDLEVIIHRGINLPGKSDDLDSYVKIELPIPTETPQRAKTHTIRDTNNPAYEENFKFVINRKSRSQLRLFKRGTLKCEVWSKGGFLRSDTIIGTVNIKLLNLESKCSIHDSFSLLDGRKSCGGMLEVEIRLRDPLLTKQVEEVQEKWLVIGC